MARIGLVYDVARIEEKMLVRELQWRAQLQLIHAPSTPLPLDGSSTGSLDAALERCVSFYTAAASAAALEAAGVRVVNSSISIVLAGDKTLATMLLARARVPVPRTMVAFTPEAAVDASSRLGLPVVLKPPVGSWGRLLALARDGETVRSIAEHRALMGGPYKVVYLQEYVEKPGRDIRAMCIGDSVPAAIYRVSESWITNTARGARAEPARVDGELEDIVLRSCEALGVEVAGVDVVEHPERGYLVLEVNAVPEYKNLARVTGVNIAALIAEHVVSTARR